MTVRSRELERLWTAQTWPFILGVLALMTFIAFESFAVTTVLPVAMADLGDIGWYSFGYAATVTTGLIGMVIGGNWADRCGPRRPLTVGGSVFITGLALCVAAPETITFILGRLLQGIGGGIDSVVLYVLIARHIPDGSRPRMFGLLTAAWLVPSLAGPVIAGALAEAVNWRVVFGIVLVGSAASLAGLLRVTREPAGIATPTPARGAWTAVIGRNGMFALLAVAMLIVLHLSGQAAPPISVVIAAAASVALIVTARGILPVGTLTLRGAPQRLVALRALLGATVGATDVYLTLYLQTERGHPPMIAGLVVAGGAGGWALGAWIQGRFSSAASDNRRLITAAVLLVSAGPACVLAHTLSTLTLWVVVIGCVAMGTGMGIAYPRLSSATLTLAGAKEQGAYSAALQSGESMSVGVATALIAAVLAAGATFSSVYAVLLGLAGVTVLIAILGTAAQRTPAQLCAAS